MPERFCVALTRADIERRCGALDQFAGVRLITLGDGLERGIRMLEFRSGTGLRFTVIVDRAMDIADCDFQGAAIGWHSLSGFRHPWNLVIAVIVKYLKSGPGGAVLFEDSPLLFGLRQKRDIRSDGVLRGLCGGVLLRRAENGNGEEKGQTRYQVAMLQE